MQTCRGFLWQIVLTWVSGSINTAGGDTDRILGHNVALVTPLISFSLSKRHLTEILEMQNSVAALASGGTLIKSKHLIRNLRMDENYSLKVPVKAEQSICQDTCTLPRWRKASDVTYFCLSNPKSAPFSVEKFGVHLIDILKNLLHIWKIFH